MKGLRDDSFLRKLTEETHQTTDQAESDNVISFDAYFDKKFQATDSFLDVTLEAFLIKNRIYYNQLDYFSDAHFFRLIHQDVTFDFPDNWSIFTQLKKMIDDDSMPTAHISIEQTNDSDNVLDVLSSIFGELSAIICAKEDQTIVFIAVSSANQNSIDWLKKYFSSNVNFFLSEAA